MQSRYTAPMRFQLALAATLSLAALPATAPAADTIMAPPEVNADAEIGAKIPEAIEKEPDLNREFKAPEKDEEVEIHSYQRKDGAKITEYASHGHVFMIKVQPEGGLPAYYLYDSDGDGNFERRLPGGYKRISPPTWVIKRF